jgi:hypothetical protein
MADIFDGKIANNEPFSKHAQNLEKKKAVLADKLSLAREKKLSEEESQQIKDEYSALQYERKLLALYADGIEKSRNNIAANMRS